MTKKGKIINSIIWIIGLFVLWEVVAFIMKDVVHDPMATKKLTSFHKIVVLFLDDWKSLINESSITLSRASIGFLTGALIGFILAIIMSISKIVEKIAMPYLIISQMIPILGLAPIIFSLVKDLDTSRIVITAYMTFFPVSINMLSGFKSVESDKKDLMYSFATKRPIIYLKLMIPYSVPYLFAGLKIAAPLSITASVLIDTLSVKNGIGQKIVYSLYGGGTSGSFWPAVVCGALLGVLSYYFIALLEYVLLPWNREK